jgi:hypothetical protein
VLSWAVSPLLQLLLMLSMLILSQDSSQPKGSESQLLLWVPRACWLWALLLL